MTKPTHGGPRKGSGRHTEDGTGDTKRHNVSLDRETIKRAKKIGDGNLSRGIRKAVKHYPTT